MTLVQSWIDSLRLLKPKNLWPFMVRTLKSIAEVYTLMLKSFWWLVPVVMGCVGVLFLVLTYVYPSYYGSLRPTPDFTLAWFNMPVGSYVLYSLMFLATCFIVRPSGTQKNWSYLIKQYRKIILYWFVQALISASGSLYWSGMDRSLLAEYVWVGTDVFLVLFFLDSSGGPKNFFVSIWYSLKMMFFNVPIIFLINVVLTFFIRIVAMCYYYVCNNLFAEVATKTESVVPVTVVYGIDIMVWNVIGILLLPIVVSIYMHIYRKKIHEQPYLYGKHFQKDKS